MQGPSFKAVTTRTVLETKLVSLVSCCQCLLSVVLLIIQTKLKVSYMFMTKQDNNKG